MDLPLDILRYIVSICKIRDIVNLYLVDKSFCSLCHEKNLWLEKFKEKNLDIIDTKINSLSEYINEYKKVSYATYTSNCLVDMITCDKYQIQNYICCFTLDNLEKILNIDHPIFIKIKENDDPKIYIKIIIRIRGEITIRYRSHNKDHSGFNILTENRDKNFTVSLISKILYNYPLIIINDFNNLPLVVSKYNLDEYNIWFKNVHPERKEYWDECYSKYEELYF